MEDPICAYRYSDCRDLLWHTTFSSSKICARYSFGKADAIMGPTPQPMGIPGRSRPAGRWNRVGTEQKNSLGRNLNWRMDDRRYSVPVSAYSGARSQRTADE